MPTVNELLKVLKDVIGVRGANGDQEPTAAIGFRENWPNRVFVAVQGHSLSVKEMIEIRVALNEYDSNIGYVIDARSMFNSEWDFANNGLSTPSAHAEMTVLASMLEHRLDHGEIKLKASKGIGHNILVQKYINSTKYTEKYFQERVQKKTDFDFIKTKVKNQGRRIRIASNAQACLFCANLMDEMGIEHTACNKKGETVDIAGPKPLTGWWNPLIDKSFGNSNDEWNQKVPGTKK